MKLINSKDIEKILDDNTDPIDVLDDFDESEHRNPCWEVRIDRSKNKMLFLVDKEEKFSVSLTKFKSEDITVNLLASFIKLLRDGKMDELKKAIKMK